MTTGFGRSAGASSGLATASLSRSRFTPVAIALRIEVGGQMVAHGEPIGRLLLASGGLNRDFHEALATEAGFKISAKRLGPV
jgi:hypothetical protein